MINLVWASIPPLSNSLPIIQTHLPSRTSDMELIEDKHLSYLTVARSTLCLYGGPLMPPRMVRVYVYVASDQRAFHTRADALIQFPPQSLVLIQKEHLSVIYSLIHLSLAGYQPPWVWTKGGWSCSFPQIGPHSLISSSDSERDFLVRESPQRPPTLPSTLMLHLYHA